MNKISINNYLNHHLITLDGAMGTELEKYDVKTNDSLWSANALINHLDKIKQVHQSYFKAGADITITDTYQANIKAFEDRGYSHVQALKFIQNGINIAKEARDENNPKGLVAGCVGPYGTYLADGSEYTGNYQLSNEAYYNFHYEKIKTIIETGADLISIDTIPNFKEVKFLGKLMDQNFSNTPYWISLSIKNPAYLADGTPINQVVQWINEQTNAVGIGINCTPIPNITPILKNIHHLTNLPLIVYPNPGDKYNPITKTWTTSNHNYSFEKLVPEWIKLGAKVIGGCCRTTPNDIKIIHTIIQTKKSLE